MLACRCLLNTFPKKESTDLAGSLCRRTQRLLQSDNFAPEHLLISRLGPHCLSL